MHAQKLVEKGNDALDRGAHDLAIELYMQAVTLEPDHLEGRRGLRRAELSKYEAFYPSGLTRSLSTFGPRFVAFFMGLFKSHEKKMIAIESALAKDPKNVALSAALAAAAGKAGHKHAGIAAWEGVLQGEGFHTGRPAVLLRFAGCNLWSGLDKDRAGNAECRVD